MDSEIHFLKVPFIRYGNKIPFIVTDLITQLERNGAYSVQGIFRLAAKSTLIEEVCNMLDKGRIQDWSPYNNCILLACSLKAYFRSISKESPLIPKEFYTQVFNLSIVQDEEEGIKKLYEITHSFPPSNLYTLAYLMNFLNKIAENSEVNKMTASNLAICFAPNLVYINPKDPSELITENSRQNAIVTFFITHASKIFSDVVISEKKFLTDENIEVMKSMMISKDIRNLMLDRINFRTQSLIPFLPEGYQTKISFKDYIQKLEINSLKQ